jgi:hypothetical protein
VRRAILVALAAALLVPARAAAVDVSGAQLRVLARRAERDRGALAQLGQVTRVDGRPVDVADALAGARGVELTARLRVLAAPSPVSRSSVAHPAEEARRIVGERRFRGSSVPRPFHGILHWLGQKFRFLARPFHWLGRHIPGGDNVVWTLLAAAVVAAAAVAARGVIRRRAGRGVVRAGGAAPWAGDDPARLERAAVEAERRGDFETALRLRFRAGLVRLGRAELIRFRASVTSAEVSSALRVAAFDRLAADFDEVVYGRRPPRRDDVETARREWPKVLAEARGR